MIPAAAPPNSPIAARLAPMRRIPAAAARKNFRVDRPRANPPKIPAVPENSGCLFGHIVRLGSRNTHGHSTTCITSGLPARSRSASALRSSLLEIAVAKADSPIAVSS